MRYIRLKCPKCDKEKIMQLERFNEELSFAFGVGDEESDIYCYECLEAYHVIEIFDHNPMELKIESLVLHQNPIFV